MSSQTKCSRLGEKLEQGPERQAASAECSGGVSADIGSSDLDEYTLVTDEEIDNPLSCSLPFWSSTGNCGNDLPASARPQYQPRRREHCFQSEDEEGRATFLWVFLLKMIGIVA